jgi:hypothetical protein
MRPRLSSNTTPATSGRKQSSLRPPHGGPADHSLLAFLRNIHFRSIQFDRQMVMQKVPGSKKVRASAVYSLIFDRGIMGLPPTQGDEKRLLFSNYCPWGHGPPLCHLDRSAAQWRDLRSSGPFLEMFFDRAKWSNLRCPSPPNPLREAPFSRGGASIESPRCCYSCESAGTWRETRRDTCPTDAIFFRQRDYPQQHSWPRVGLLVVPRPGPAIS